MDLHSVLTNIAIEKGIVISDAELIDFIASLPLQDLENEARGTIQVSLWDGISNVGNCTAEDIKAWSNFPKEEGAKGYLVYIDGRLVFFQYHTLSGMRAITDANWQEESSQHVSQIVEDMVRQKVVDLFLQRFINRTQANLVNTQNLDIMAALTDIAIKVEVL